MGESLVEAPTVDKKMYESVKSDGRLEVSVSFGRFENDALAWEKWSSFSPNKYLEEVGTLSTPGSVAQKKAYFEAHYKKIATAKKTEELEQEKPTDSVTLTPDESYSENSSGNYARRNLSNGEKFGEENDDTASGNYARRDLSNGEKFGEENDDTASMIDLTNLAIDDEAKQDNARVLGVEQVFCANGLIESIVSEEKVGSALALECESLTLEEAKDEMTSDVGDSKLDAREGPALVGVEIPREDSSPIVEKAPERKNGVEISRVLEKEKSKSKNAIQKATLTKKERNLFGTSKKSVASPVVKSSKALTPRNSKPISNSTPTAASQSSKKKMSRSPLPNSKIATPTSLHMSLSLGPTNSSLVVPITRKSLIMEQMGDKDIVRRAFKSFQNFANGLSSDERSSTVKQVQSTALKSKVYTAPTPRKGSEGLMKDVAKVATQRYQSGTKSKPSPSGSDKSPSLKKTMTVSPSTGLRSDERAEKRKQFLKNLEAKSIAREAENAKRDAKSKEEKDSEFKKLKESLTFKAKPLPSFYRN